MAPASSDDTPDLPGSISPNDVRAFEAAFAAYLDPLCRYVFSYVQTWEVAEDIVHDVFCELWVKLARPEPVQNLSGYLYTAARHQALNYLKRQRVRDRYRRESETSALLRPPAAAPPAVERHLAERERAAAVQRAIDELPTRQREVIYLRWHQQLSHEQIASTLGIALKTVAEHLRRATDHLRRTLPPSLRQRE